MNKAAVLIMAVAVVFGVMFGQVLGVSFSLVSMIWDPEYVVSFADIPWMMQLVFANSEFISAFWRDAALGLVFAALGCWGIFKNLMSGTKPQEKRIIDLE